LGPPLCAQESTVEGGGPNGRASIWVLLQSFQMKFVFSIVGVILLSSFAIAQSGRRTKEIKVAVPPPAEQTSVTDNTSQTIAETSSASITAEGNQDYRCLDDGTLERILEPQEGSAAEIGRMEPGERILSAKETDSRVEITSKPQPSYTKEARRNGVQGFVAVKILLSGNGKVSRVRVMKGLPAGLTESAIRAACRMKFRPALKDGTPVSQWVIAEYAFRLSHSSIFRP
jgi:TonB family protein